MTNLLTNLPQKKYMFIRYSNLEDLNHILTYSLILVCPDLRKTNDEQKWPAFSNVQLYDPAQTLNIRPGN
jgi:hypothetical protein